MFTTHISDLASFFGFLLQLIHFSLPVFVKNAIYAQEENHFEILGLRFGTNVILLLSAATPLFWVSKWHK